MNHSESLYIQEVEELKNENAQLKQKLADLTREHIEIEAILSCIADGVLVYDKEGHIVRSNDAAEKILKLEDTEKNLTLQERVPKKYRVYTEEGQMLETEEMPAYKSAVFGKTSMNNLFRIETDNQAKWVNLSAAPLIVNGRHHGGIISLSDVTSRKLSEQNLVRERELFEGIFNNIPVMITIYDPELKNFRLNKVFRQITDWSEEDASKNDLLRLVFPDPVYRQEISKFMKNLAPGWKELNITAKNGDQIETSWANIKLSSGILIGIGLDIREIKKAEEAVKESEDTFSKMFHALPIGVSLATYPDEKLTNVNKAWLNLAEYSELSEVIGKTKVELGVISASDMERINFEFVLYGNVRNAETIFYSKTGQQSVININKNIIAIGNKKFVLSTNEDITNQKKYEQEIKQKNEELTRFIYTVSHDLKSPLVTIKSFTSYLKEDIDTNDKAAQDKDLGYIDNAADKMGRLLDELLELSRIGRKEEPKTEISLETVAKMAVDLVAGRISQRKVKITFSGPPVMLYGFTQRFVQLFQNLIDNAVKFMGDQPDPKIEIGAYIDNQINDIVIFVTDNGLGIDPRYHHKIFGLFEKMDNKTEGTGIGLALVKRIIEVHEGSIWFKSEGIGRGTTFYFTLKRTSLIND